MGGYPTPLTLIYMYACDIYTRRHINPSCPHSKPPPTKPCRRYCLRRLPSTSEANAWCTAQASLLAAGCLLMPCLHIYIRPRIHDTSILHRRPSTPPPTNTIPRCMYLALPWSAASSCQVLLPLSCSLGLGSRHSTILFWFAHSHISLPACPSASASTMCARFGILARDASTVGRGWVLFDFLPSALRSSHSIHVATMMQG